MPRTVVYLLLFWMVATKMCVLCVRCEIIYSSLPTLNLFGPLATAALAKDPHQYQHHLHHHRLIPFSAYNIKSLTPIVSAKSQQALVHCSCCPRAHLLSLTKHNNDTLPIPSFIDSTTSPALFPPTISIACHGLQSGHCYLPYPLPPRATNSYPLGIHQFILHRFLHQLFRDAFPSVGLDFFLC